jgi:hypothetical protein
VLRITPGYGELGHRESGKYAHPPVRRNQVQARNATLVALCRRARSSSEFSAVIERVGMRHLQRSVDGADERPVAGGVEPCWFLEGG